MVSCVGSKAPTTDVSVEFQTSHSMPQQAISQAQFRRIEDIKAAVATEQFSRMMIIKRDIKEELEERFDHFLQVAPSGLDAPQVYFYDRDDLKRYMAANDWSRIQDRTLQEFALINANGEKPKQPLLIRVQEDALNEDEPPAKMRREDSDSDMF